MNTPVFTAHNIRLDNGMLTMPLDGRPESEIMEDRSILISTRRILDLVFPQNKEAFSIVDLGCLEGGYSVAFARMGFQTLGIEVRDINIQCCEFVKQNVHLPNLRFVQDNVMNIAKYGEFDAAFCCGLLYHLDKPKAFLEQLSRQTRKLLIVQTHFSIRANVKTRYTLSPLTQNEGLPGRWYGEFSMDATLEQRQNLRWASFHNNASFWIQREHLIALISDLGFGTVLEQFDHFVPDMKTKLENSYTDFLRGTFIGIRD